jgi:hypothetical protein
MHEWSSGESNPDRRLTKAVCHPNTSRPKLRRPDSNRRRTAYETVLEATPVHSAITMSGRQESNLPRTAYQTVALPPVPGPLSSKVGRIRTHSAGFGDRLLSQEHNLVHDSGRDRSRTCKGLRLARVPGGCHQPIGLPFRNRRKEWESNPQGLAAHLFSRQAPSPIGSSFRIKERPEGFEPSHPPWQGGRLPGYIMDACSSGGWN